jgi:NAD(P)-dependent dehydrogenase (short-subunit alcohol dehydrogenase family)
MSAQVVDNAPRPVILITGTSSGIGLLTAVELSRRGARVFASMRDLSRGDNLRSAEAEAGLTVDVLQLDVTSESSVQNAVDQVLRSAGRLDVVVNNAGTTAVGPLECADEQAVDSIFQTNIIGVIRVMRAVLPAMRRQGGGRIVNIGSVIAEPRSGAKLMSLYATTKAALQALTLDLNKELAPLGIISILCEGGISAHTDMVRRYFEDVAVFGGAELAYAEVEATASRMGKLLDAIEDPGHEAARLIADACTTPTPAVRWPPEAQASIDKLHMLSDDDYLSLCVDEGVDGILDRNRALGIRRTVWPLANY